MILRYPFSASVSEAKNDSHGLPDSSLTSSLTVSSATVSGSYSILMSSVTVRRSDSAEAIASGSSLMCTSFGLETRDRSMHSAMMSQHFSPAKEKAGPLPFLAYAEANFTALSMKVLSFLHPR